ncbi:DUF2057 domain-containing protein [Pseudoalteromonas xiamenensis]
MRRIIFVTGLLFCAVSHAATINFPEEFYPLQVDEKTIEHSWFSKIRTLSLTPGHYKLKLKYSDLYELGYDEHEVVESAPFWVDLEVPKEGTYRIRFSRAESIEQARRFAKQPLITLRAENNGEDTQVNAVAEPVMEQVEAPIAPITTLRPESSTKPANVRAPNAPIAAPPTPAVMLEFWWQQASQAERAEFLKRIGQ